MVKHMIYSRRFFFFSLSLSFSFLTGCVNDATTPIKTPTNTQQTQSVVPKDQKKPSKSLSKGDITTSKKKALLTELVGEYSLHSISGAMGANSLVDYNVVNGEWKASGSSIAQGMREGYEIELSADDIQKLKTSKIIVADDLTVSFVCNNKTYFKAPFSDDGMTYKLKKKAEDFSFQIPKELTPASTFIKDVLYVYAQDNIPSKDIQDVDFVGVEADAVLISYLQKSQNFEVSVFFGECCSNAIYTFK